MFLFVAFVLFYALSVFNVKHEQYLVSQQTYVIDREDSLPFNLLMQHKLEKAKTCQKRTAQAAC